MEVPIMFSRKNVQRATPEIHSICTALVDQPERRSRLYWPVVILIVISALTQAVNELFFA